MSGDRGEVRFTVRFGRAPRAAAGSASGRDLSVEERERRLVRRHEEREDVRDTSALVDLVNFYRVLGREEEIRERLVAFRAEAGSDLEIRAWCCVLLGQSCERTRDYEQAIEHYREGVGCEPCGTFTAYFLHNNLGYCLNVVGRYDEAEWYCRTAIRIDGSRANGFKNLGISLAGQGDLAGALRCWVQATRVNAADPRSLAHAEELLEQRPELLSELPGLAEALEECRRAVDVAQEMVKEEWEGKGEETG